MPEPGEIRLLSSKHRRPVSPHSDSIRGQSTENIQNSRQFSADFDLGVRSREAPLSSGSADAIGDWAAGVMHTVSSPTNESPCWSIGMILT